MHRHVLLCAVLLAANTACAQETGGGDVVARFGDQVVTAAELEGREDLRLQMIAIRQQEYEAKRRVLDELLFDRLVDQAAKAEGLDREQYLEREVTAKVAAPGEAQISAVLGQYRAQLDPDTEKARQQVIAALRRQGEQQEMGRLKERLFEAAGVLIVLEPLRFEPVLADHHPARGADRSAPVVLVEYTDFQCPFCHRVQPTLDEILRRYDGKVRHVFKQLPLDMHAQARLAAEASMCAADQGRFWELHDWLFQNPKGIRREALLEQAQALSLDVAAFGACLDGHAHGDRVSEDLAEAQAFGINGTPGFLINGRLLRGAVPMEDFLEVIEDELRRAGIASTAQHQPAGSAPTS